MPTHNRSSPFGLQASSWIQPRAEGSRSQKASMAAAAAMELEALPRPLRLALRTS